ncbi:MAG: tripartite tricarboxylate transporter TctB family protein, partial [Pseudomonadota bacterium]
MRIAELIMAVVLALLALGIMYKAGERPDWSGEARFSNVGFGESGSPAGGFWPFWIAAIMFLCCIWTFVNGLLRNTGPSKTGGPYLDRHGIIVLLTVGVPVFFLVLLTDYISMYFAMALFLFYYLLVLGRHGIVLSTAMAGVLPFWMYLFFDITMTRTLPKGVLSIEDGIYTPLGNFFR